MKHLKSIDEFKQVNEQLFGNITRELTKGILKNDDSKSKDDSGGTGAGGGTGPAPDKAAGSVGDYGKFSDGSSKSSPLAIVFG